MDKVPAILWVTDPELRIASLLGAGLQGIGVRAEDFIDASVETLYPRSPQSSLQRSTPIRPTQVSQFDALGLPAN